MPLPSLDSLVPTAQFSSGEKEQTSPHRALFTPAPGHIKYNYSEDGNDDVFGRNLRRDITELIDEEN